jgi:hypothetical protein
MGAPRVESYAFGRMVVDGEKHTNDLILLPDRVEGNWWRNEGHRLSADDLDPVFDAEPDVLVVGTGANGVMDVPRETREAITDAGIELRIAKTGEAWRTYNDLQDERRAAGAFHLTC